MAIDTLQVHPEAGVAARAANIQEDCKLCPPGGCACSIYGSLSELSAAPSIERATTPQSEVAEAGRLIGRAGGPIARRLAGFATNVFWNSGFGELKQKRSVNEYEEGGEWDQWLQTLKLGGDAGVVQHPEHYEERRPLSGRLAYGAIKFFAKGAARRARHQPAAEAVETELAA